MYIESPHNETFKKLLGLTSSKGLKEEGLFLLSGEKLVREFLKNPHLKIACEIPAPNHEPLAPDARQTRLAAPLFAQLSQRFEQCVYGLNLVKNELEVMQHPIARRANDLIM